MLGSLLIARRSPFDDQAGAFDRRAGFPEAAIETIAGVVLACSGMAGGDTLLELGAGTGVIGAQLAAAHPRYLGIDVSWPMLRVFRCRATDGLPALAQADADRAWPVRGGTVRAVFLSRAVHHMDLDHLADEVERVASPAGLTVMLGSVERLPGGLRPVLRREMRRRLEARGFAGLSGSRVRRRLAEILAARGARALTPRFVARWRRTDTPRTAIDSWRSKSGLAGRPVDDTVKQDLLDRLGRWAAERFGGLDTPHETIERFLLEPFLLEKNSLDPYRLDHAITSAGARA